MKHRIFALVLISFLAFAGVAVAEEVGTAVDTASSPEGVNLELSQDASDASGSCSESPSLAPVTDVLRDIEAKTCTFFQCRQQCSCPGCVRSCVDFVACECECICF